MPYTQSASPTTLWNQRGDPAPPAHRLLGGALRPEPVEHAHEAGLAVVLGELAILDVQQVPERITLHLSRTPAQRPRHATGIASSKSVIHRTLKAT
jgi:hypothetical protein